MTKIPSVEETEETAKAIIEKVRHCATPHQHPDNSAEAKAYLEGVNTAMAMLYIDLTGTPKVKGFLTTYAETQRLALLTELRDCGLLEEKEEHQDWCKLTGELEYSSWGRLSKN
jgi:DNA primase